MLVCLNVEEVHGQRKVGNPRSKQLGTQVINATCGLVLDVEACCKRQHHA